MLLIGINHCQPSIIINHYQPALVSRVMVHRPWCYYMCQDIFCLIIICIYVYRPWAKLIVASTMKYQSGHQAQPILLGPRPEEEGDRDRLRGRCQKGCCWTAGGWHWANWGKTWDLMVGWFGWVGWFTGWGGLGELVDCLTQRLGGSSFRLRRLDVAWSLCLHELRYTMDTPIINHRVYACHAHTWVRVCTSQSPNHPKNWSYVSPRASSRSRPEGPRQGQPEGPGTLQQREAPAAYLAAIVERRLGLKMGFVNHG